MTSFCNSYDLCIAGLKFGLRKSSFTYGRRKVRGGNVDRNAKSLPALGCCRTEIQSSRWLLTAANGYWKSGALTAHRRGCSARHSKGLASACARMRRFAVRTKGGWLGLTLASGASPTHSGKETTPCPSSSSSSSCSLCSSSSLPPLSSSAAFNLDDTQCWAVEHLPSPSSGNSLCVLLYS